MAAILHQPPGGIGQSRLRTVVQARLDLRLLPALCRLLLAASSGARRRRSSRSTASPPDRVRVVEPGADLPTVAGPLPDLRQGRRIAVLCVANWLPAKGILELLDAVARTRPGRR